MKKTILALAFLLSFCGFVFASDLTDEIKAVLEICQEKITPFLLEAKNVEGIDTDEAAKFNELITKDCEEILSGKDEDVPVEVKKILTYTASMQMSLVGISIDLKAKGEASLSSKGETLADNFYENIKKVRKALKKAQES